MNDKIDIHNMKHFYEIFKIKIDRDSQLFPENKEIILRYLRESELGKTLKKGQKRKIGDARNVRVAGILVSIDKIWFKKPFMQITSKDMEDFILKLDSGKITSNRGTAYKSESLMTIKKFIRKFWKWMKGDGKIYPDEVEWIDTSGESAEIQALPDLRESVEKMANIAPDYMKKAIIMALFDSGAREGEFLNLRIKDVEHLNKDDSTFVIRIRHSKTFGRPVSLPIATPYLREWLEIHPDRTNPESLLWVLSNWVQKGRNKELEIKPVSKAFFYNSIKRIGEKALGINVTPHMIRHTSATYYAPKLERAVFCKRYGWSFGSKSPDRYIDWAKVTETTTVRVIKNEDIGEVRKENKELREEMILLKEALEKRKKYDDILDKIIHDKRIQELIVNK